MKHNCRVYGLWIEVFPWGEDENSPTYEICPCCGVEFGNEVTTTEYIGNKVYEDNVLKRILVEGGYYDVEKENISSIYRIIWVTTAW